MSDGEHWDGDEPDLGAMAAEIAADFAAAHRAARQHVLDEMAAAAERGETGYIPVGGSRLATPEESAMWREQVAPSMVARAEELRDKRAAFGLSDEEAALLNATELWLQEGDPGRDA